MAVKGARRVYTLQLKDVVVRDERGRTTARMLEATSVKITPPGSENDQDDTGVIRQLT
ncbi:hypothetical protein F444_05226 [Phytophthora nicotianae P1976]|uniref:Uncharacterized protein n=1 Tax=Phytophthora nicotianae P1976 TaxID=1317066 RepID=A0A081AMS2_PHYNI|nr:hypothetical protein F444_05226 [Phytophthora nicotianae P1976]